MAWDQPAFWIGVLTGLLVVPLIIAVLVASGIISMKASVIREE